MRRWAALVTVVVAVATVASLQAFQDQPAAPEVDVVTGATPITLPLPSPVAAEPEPVAAAADPVVTSTGGTAVAVGSSSVTVVDSGGTESVVITNSGTAIANTGGNTGDNVRTGPATAIGNRATVDLRP